MNCPCCGAPTRVTNTQQHGVAVERLRRCPACDHTFRTYEQLDTRPVRPRKPAPKKAA
ncbi:MAG: hypothetical protein H6981_04660 [Gammaproteobacteria bacterium]|nr:hypothetical protein [Gammaproteobacteria bacterium]